MENLKLFVRVGIGTVGIIGLSFVSVIGGKLLLGREVDWGYFASTAKGELSVLPATVFLLAMLYLFFLILSKTIQED